MPLWGVLIIWTGSMLIFPPLLTRLVSFFICRRNKKLISEGKTVYCNYEVIDKATSKPLFHGYKYRTLNDTEFGGEVYKHFITKVLVFEKDEIICGRECKITFFVIDEPPQNVAEMIVVEEEGKQMLQQFIGYGEIFNART